MIPVAAGELFDKITILEIKSEQISDAEKLRNVQHELGLLNAIANRFADPAIEALKSELKAVNQLIWDAENVVRRFGRTSNFGEEFSKVARSTYQNNDRRAALKREISLRSGSSILEEKSHAC